MPRGGKRPNSGPKKGAIYKPTIEKAEIRRAFRDYVASHMPRMLRSQVANAIGIGHLFTRDKGGKFTRIEDMAQIDKLLAEGTEGEHYWIFAKDPSVQAFSVLVEQTMDQAPKHVDVSGPDGGPIPYKWID